MTRPMTSSWARIGMTRDGAATNSEERLRHILLFNKQTCLHVEQVNLPHMDHHSQTGLMVDFYLIRDMWGSKSTSSSRLYAFYKKHLGSKVQPRFRQLAL